MSATSAPKPALWIGLGLGVVVAGIVATRKPADPYAGLLHQPNSAPVEAAPMCPWRHPEEDLRAFFPNASGTRAETRVLSAKRLELTRKLGRPPLPEEGALHLFRVEGKSGDLGTVMVRRIKGEYGAIELVIATDPHVQVRGLRLQREREPEAVSKALSSEEWQQRLAGLSANSPGDPAVLLQGLPPAAKPSAQAVVEGLRSQLILLSVAEESGAPAAPAHHL